MGTFASRHWGAVASAGTILLVQPARSAPVLVQASARVVPSADVWAQATTQMLLGESPGVLIVTIPGSAGLAATSIELTAAAAGESGYFAFTASTLDAVAISRILRLVEQGSASLSVDSSLSTELAANGVLSGRGVQIAVLKTAQAVDGGGALAMIITFD